MKRMPGLEERAYTRLAALRAPDSEEDFWGGYSVARDLFYDLSADEQLEVACIYKALLNEPRRYKTGQVHFEHFRDLLTRWCDLMPNNESEEELQTG
ncbi:MAG TPA: hypothetical protein VGP68_14065 [Gemmataceae bacterium]|jgi:hypothetical protein|nr:hypothetical protein [Gemmataceae bacterium]